MQAMVQSFAIPSKCATKALQIKQSPAGTRKIVISTNWLVLFGFESGTPVIEKSLGPSKGMTIRKASLVSDDSIKPKKVYHRMYKTRKNNPLETLMQISSQSLIDESFGDECNRVHVYFEDGCVTVKPLTSHKEAALKNLTPESKDQLFAVCSSGVDVDIMVKNGFQCHSLLDRRPPEKRDSKRKSDLTETGALTALRNSSGITNLFNEDINTISTQVLKDAFSDDMFSVLCASVQCDDFSNAKANSLKDKSIDDLSSSMDMAYDMLRIVDALKPPVAVFEQVQGWYKSDIFKLFDLRMRRWGYKSNLLLANATDFGGLTLRPRGYAVFSCLPCDFSFESPQGLSESVWEQVKPLLSECRDVTSNKSIQKGKANGRLRVLNKDSKFCPTYLKSQPRMAGDSVVFEDDGRYYWPTEKAMKLIMGIDESFSLDCVSQDIGSEIIGQSVDGQFQSMVARSIKKHIGRYFNGCLEKPKNVQVCENVTEVNYGLPTQLVMF